MSLGFSIDSSYYEIGAASFLHSFFSTISYHLEPNGWGSEYPVLMKELYQGELSWKKAEKLIEDVKIIRQKLSNYSPDKVIWDIEDLSKRPPWGDNISPEITNLSNYFGTSDGNDLFDVLLSALYDSINEKTDISIV